MQNNKSALWPSYIANWIVLRCVYKSVKFSLWFSKTIGLTLENWSQKRMALPKILKGQLWRHFFIVNIVVRCLFRNSTIDAGALTLENCKQTSHSIKSLHMYIHIYVYARIYMRICIYVYIRKYLDCARWESSYHVITYVYAYIRIYTYIYAYQHIRIFLARWDSLYLVFTCTMRVIVSCHYVYVYIYTYVCVCIYVYVYTYSSNHILCTMRVSRFWILANSFWKSSYKCIYSFRTL